MLKLHLREAMHQAIGEPRITLRAAPAVIAARAGAAPEADIAHEEGYEGRVLPWPPIPLSPGADCRIEWRGAGSRTQRGRRLKTALDRPN